jgi:methylthioribose-1-phosphate isomerase
MPLSTIEWVGPADEPRVGHVRLIDQTVLPCELVYLDCEDTDTLWEAIKMLRVRGAPALGIAGAMGVVLGVRRTKARDGEALVREVDEVGSFLATSRPTAVNLFWAIDRLKAKARSLARRSVDEILAGLLADALAVQDEDRRICRTIGRYGAALLPDDATVITHCNAGGLATADYGTALGVFFAAHEAGKKLRVYADETRPLLQGARLTAWELKQAGIPVTVICDSMAAVVMRDRKVDAVVVGADRIAANGDTANKIGTYGLSIVAKAHGVPFYVAAPASTFDLTLASGALIPIEERPGDEITRPFGCQTAPTGVDAFNPAFDVTPAANIAAIITERGVLRPPLAESIRRMIGNCVG